jgi:telomerase reverse transcriptase
MQEGFPSHGCTLNAAKTTLNFSLRDDDDDDDGGGGVGCNLYRGADGSCFVRWIGLLINTTTCEVQADYTRYVGGDLAAAVNVASPRKGGLQLRLKLCLFMRPKCHPLLFDGRVNQPDTARLNAYQVQVITPTKTTCTHERKVGRLRTRGETHSG